MSSILWSPFQNFKLMWNMKNPFKHSGFKINKKVIFSQSWLSIIVRWILRKKMRSNYLIFLWQHMSFLNMFIERNFNASRPHSPKLERKIASKVPILLLINFMSLVSFSWALSFGIERGQWHQMGYLEFCYIFLILFIVLSKWPRVSKLQEKRII